MISSSSSCSFSFRVSTYIAVSSIVRENVAGDTLRGVAVPSPLSWFSGTNLSTIGRVEMIGSRALKVAIQGNGPRHCIGEAVTSNSFTDVAVFSLLSSCSGADLSTIGRVEMVSYITLPVAIEGNGSFHLLVVDETLNAFRSVAMMTNTACIGSSNLVV